MNISQINIYPIKSLKGIGLESSVVEKRGLRFDRRWMLTDKDGMFFTQRETPKMAAVRIELGDDSLKASAEGFGELEVPMRPDAGVRQNVTVWQSTVEGEVYNGQVSEWFSEVLGRECQLVLMPESTERHVSEQFDSGEDIVSFADGYPLLLIGEGSLEELNRRIKENADKSVRVPIPMDRFRPSVVVRGSEPFAEDNWAKVRIGEAVFRVAKPCGRCVMTTIDQQKGEFDGKEPLRTLATFRKAADVRPVGYEKYGHTSSMVLFGENLVPDNSGVTVNIGDEVDVLEYRQMSSVLPVKSS
jgi:uncharacterized protein YcbX